MAASSTLLRRRSIISVALTLSLARSLNTSLQASLRILSWLWALSGSLASVLSSSNVRLTGFTSGFLTLISPGSCIVEYSPCMSNITTVPPRSSTILLERMQTVLLFPPPVTASIARCLASWFTFTLNGTLLSESRLPILTQSSPVGPNIFSRSPGEARYMFPEGSGGRLGDTGLP